MAKKPNEAEAAARAHKQESKNNNKKDPKEPKEPKQGKPPKSQPPPDGDGDSGDENDGWAPQPFYGQGPPPADMVAPRGTPEWKKAVAARQKWAVDQAWRERVGNNLDLSDNDALGKFLNSIGIADEQGGGRHLYNLLLGNLPESEGGGRNTDPNRNISWALENQIPEWKQGVDRAIQGGHLIKDFETGLLVNPTPGNGPPRWFDNFGNEVAAPYSGVWHGSEQYRYDQDQREQESHSTGIVHDGAPANTPPPPPPFNPSPWEMPNYAAMSGTKPQPLPQTKAYGKPKGMVTNPAMSGEMNIGMPGPESGPRQPGKINRNARATQTSTPAWYSTPWKF